MKPTDRSLLTVADNRSHFLNVGLGWRTDPGVHTEAEGYLRRAIAAVPRFDHAMHPLSAEWTTSEGAVCLTAVLPSLTADRWLSSAIDQTQKIPISHIGDVVVSAVGTPERLAGLNPLATALGQDGTIQPTSKIPSRMRKTVVNDFEQTLITGQDPVGDVGKAATFLAICILAGGPGTLLPNALQKEGHGAFLQVIRGLQDRETALTWQMLAPKRGTLSAFETALSTVSALQLDTVPHLVSQARQFACSNLNRPWGSPFELARSLVHYEVMGWGSSLILTPKIELAQVDHVKLEYAIERLMDPIKEVLGRS